MPSRSRSQLFRSLPNFFVLLVLLAPMAAAQGPTVQEDQGASGLGLALRRLPTVGSLLYITAHPDDENNAVLAKISRGQGIHTGLLTLTRGDGGQNEIGPELFEALGVLRTEELLAIHRFDFVEQFFTPAYEFGYSYSVEETLEKWNEKETLRDIVKVIRRFRPHIIVTLNPEGAGGGQHHQASAQLAQRAFQLAADPSQFPEQIQQGLRPWQALRLYQAENPGLTTEGADKYSSVTGAAISIGDYDPLLGESYLEFGARARNNHRSQGMNTLARPAPAVAFYRLVEGAGRLSGITPDFFSGLDLSLRSISTLEPELGPEVEQLERLVMKAQADYSGSDYSQTARDLMAGLRKLRELSRGARHPEVKFLLDRKEKDFERAATRAHFIHFDALLKDSRDGTAVPGQELQVELTFLNRHPDPVTAVFTLVGAASGWEVKMERNDKSSALFRARVPQKLRYTQPYWSRQRGASREDRFQLEKGYDGTQPFPPPELRAQVKFTSSGESVLLEIPVYFRWFDADSAKERRMELHATPELSVWIHPPFAVIGAESSNDSADAPVRKQFQITVQNNVPGSTTAFVRMVLPAGWKSDPPHRELTFRYENEQAATSFWIEVPPGTGPGEFLIGAVAEKDGKRYANGLRPIAYHHIQTRFIYAPAETTLKIFDVSIPTTLKVGYISGVGDEVGLATEQLDAEVTYLTSQDLASADLNRFDVIITGVRAYLNRTDLIANNHRLLKYVEEGGHLVVQYNKYEFNQAQFGPYPAQINNPHDRVTAEDSRVKVLQPDHPLFNWPNRINEEDWKGWVQERGLYFLGQWDSRYQPLLELEDPFPYNNQPKQGSLVVAQYGKGTYVYTGLGFFRQLPEGVAGAYRLWANLISLAKFGK
ncbi:MAG: PIG-L family deacetylase [Acidobacteria bacterium]|nr:PIG-L family deacetylase [Acidobacteriota bacterium]